VTTNRFYAKMLKYASMSLGEHKTKNQLQDASFMIKKGIMIVFPVVMASFMAKLPAVSLFIF
jgi:hypothetical protein